MRASVMACPQNGPNDVVSWSEQQDLNLRPPAPKAGALPDCAMLRRPGTALDTRLAGAQQGALLLPPARSPDGGAQRRNPGHRPALRLRLHAGYRSPMDLRHRPVKICGYAT